MEEEVRKTLDYIYSDYPNYPDPEPPKKKPRTAEPHSYFSLGDNFYFRNSAHPEFSIMEIGQAYPFPKSSDAPRTYKGLVGGKPTFAPTEL